MNENFMKFRRRLRLAAFVRAFLYSLSFGFLIFSVLFVLDKRGIIELGVRFSVMIAFGAAALLILALLLFLTPTDRKVARVLDRELYLGERVETMLEYFDRDGGMYELQRMDTDKRLGEIPVEKLKPKRIALLITALSVSAVIFGSSFAIPAIAEPTPDDPVIDGYEQNWRIARLYELIESVESDTYASEEIKDELITVIRGLIDVIGTTNKDAILRQRAVSALVEVESLRSKHVSALTYADLFRAADYTGLDKLAKSLEEFDDRDFTDALEDIADGFTSPLEDSVNAFLDVFNSVVTAGGFNAEGDALTREFSIFATKLRSVVDNSGDSDDITVAVDDLTFVIFELLFAQHDDNKIVNVVREGIIEIFELTEEDIAGGAVPTPPSDTEDTENPDEDTEEDITPGAGYGKGDKLAGSNDTLYDHEKRDLVTLPEVVSSYYSKFDEVMDGMDEELRRAMEKYFEFLQKPESK